MVHGLLIISVATSFCLRQLAKLCRATELLALLGYIDMVKQLEKKCDSNAELFYALKRRQMESGIISDQVQFLGI
jgi:hypothetical protein